MSDRVFKIAFPVVTLPVDRGAKRAIVIMSVSPSDNRQLLIATCIDIDGTPHVNVPFVRSEVEKAAQDPIIFVESKEKRTAPTTGLIRPDGRPI